MKSVGSMSRDSLPERRTRTPADADFGTVACAYGACGGSAITMVLKVSSLCGGSASSTTFKWTVTITGTSPVTAGCGSGHV